MQLRVAVSRIRRLGWGLALWAALPVAAQAPSVAASPALQAFTENLPPLNYEDERSARGFSVELLEAMAAQAKLGVSIKVLPWARAIQTAQHTPNSVLFSLTRTAEREAQYLWVGPISDRRIMVYQLARSQPIAARSLDDLRSLRVGAVRESATARQLEEQGFGAGRLLDLAPDYGANVRKLLAGRVDVIVSQDWTVAWHLAQHRLPFSTVRAVMPYDADKSYWFGLRLDTDPAVVQRLQAALDTLRKDGRYDRLRGRYFE
ncbi:substrate-binding periplasmic protein [Inhella gelatinilytica]|uniref:Amino acid ABC transporter substrate-binding protein n=1 Tax=Inhella gelatinilytica TaxID=2795030 RepID=A0A931IZ74_9BURK|nr:transporter substrate-binding domain-containing protein [Inhella gelatinilytica]MBH9553710.1 amino acid ABC transporter substrate-binding protein [Inhella gelatinilytica]